MSNDQAGFPKVNSHDEVRCKSCTRLLSGAPINFPAPTGKYGKVCSKCYVITWYDLARSERNSNY